MRAETILIMTTKPFVYLATSLTHVPVEERPQIIELVQHLKSCTHFLEWAFDVTTWTPKPVKNVFKFDITCVTELADFVAGVFFTSAGSDGRGAELYARAVMGVDRGLVIYTKEGIKITPFITDMARFHKVQIATFKTIAELATLIVEDACKAKLPYGMHVNRKRQLEVFDVGGLTSCIEAYEQYGRLFSEE